MFNVRYLAAGCTLITFSASVSAVPFNSFDPRTMSMGGTGVAVASAGTAPLFNPALLATTAEEDDFALNLLGGARAYDPDDVIDAIDDFQDANYVDNLDNSIFLAENNPNDPNAYRSVATDTRSLSSGLTTVSDKPLQGEVGAGLVIGIPSRSLGVAFSATGWSAFGGVANYRDEGTLNDLAGDIDTWAQCLEDNQAALGSCDPTVLNLTYVVTDPADPRGNVGDVLFDPNNDLASTVDIRGVLLMEYALAFSREVVAGDQTFSVGLTPKYVQATTFEYTMDVDTADTDDLTDEKYRKEYTNFNMDVGLAKDYANGWRTGFVIKNLVPQTYETVEGNEIDLNPMARLGVSHENDWSTVAVDLDLTENEPAGLEEDKSRYLAVGAELNAFDWAQIRVGYRADLNNSDRNIPSAGLGLSPFGVHLDVAVAQNGNEMGASAQLGFRF